MTTQRPITEDDLHAFVDQALDIARHAEIVDYLGRHPEIARRVETFAAQRTALRTVLGPIADEPVPPQLSLQHMIEARRRPQGFSLSWRMAAAAAVLLAFGGAGGWSLHATLEPWPSGIAALAEEAADTYAVFAPDKGRPVEIKAADTAQLVRWVSLRLQHDITVPDLSSAGYRFMGGRLVVTPHGPAAMFMYDNDQGARLVMLLRPMATEQSAQMSGHARGSVGGVTWADGGIGYSLVGPESPDRLHPLADEVRRQFAKSI